MISRDSRRCRRSLLILGMVLIPLGACSFSSGGSGGSSPSKTYIVMPNGEAVPAQTMNRPPGS
ncbi:hypothetical protein [Rhizosaccharibacter radicis]|uniref:Uncharacterized protein n=1 Tax=Rhizosaccharibacter radicis TaxID=2782605 RepID=A0ABT1VSR9_9PROT|nr:hypothetical protein [Acetobacteraceae bacterium KSS12]